MHGGNSSHSFCVKSCAHLLQECTHPGHAGAQKGVCLLRTPCLLVRRLAAIGRQKCCNPLLLLLPLALLLPLLLGLPHSLSMPLPLLLLLLLVEVVGGVHPGQGMYDVSQVLRLQVGQLDLHGLWSVQLDGKVI